MAADAAVAPTESPDVVAWTRGHALPIETVRPGSGFAELEVLRSLVGDARIVALGETTHGSREVAQMKHRLVEFLATQMGFTLLAVETSMPEARLVNDYVLGADGDPAERLRGLAYWMWSTEEARAMIEWMRGFNRDEGNRRAGRHLEFAGFDMQDPKSPARIARDYLAGRDRQFRPTLEAGMAGFETNGKFSFVSGAFPVERVRGHRIVFSGWIKTENVADGWAGLFWAASAGGPMPVSFDNMANRGARGTTPWRHYEIALDIPAVATSATLGLVMGSNGRAWFDDLVFTIDGAPFDPAGQFDFGFEGSDLGGLTNRTPDGPRVELAADEVHGGRQSLRIAGSAPGPNPAEERRRIWRECEERLRALKPLDATDAGALHWAAQNAHIVNQWFATQGGPSWMRDRCMAENAEWLLEQNPRAKIILWAHNGHVGRRAGEMGGFLAAQHSADMVVIGFATGTGSFRAQEIDRWGLGEFPLDPPPSGSVEAVFAATRIPRFLLDLRPARVAEGAASWFAGAHEHRLIGGKTTTRQFKPREVARNYDAMVWIAETTAVTELPLFNEEAPHKQAR